MELGRLRYHLLTALVALSAAGCGSSQAPAISHTAAPPKQQQWEAIATLQGKSGAAVTGTATFIQLGNGPVHVHVQIEHAAPGLHGLHVHEAGDCADPEAKNAGGHFNPAGKMHAGTDTEARHAGDLGNIEVREDGIGDLVLTTDLLNVHTGATSVVGRSVVFHAGQDDQVTQPTGNSGARQGCGVIVASPQ